MRIGALNRLTRVLLANSLLLVFIIAMQILSPAAPSVDGSVSLPDGSERDAGQATILQ
jgi:hypothetical protein